MFLIGLILLTIGATTIVAKSILEAIEDDDPGYTTPLLPGQLTRLASATGVGMTEPEKDAYIQHLRDKLASLSNTPVTPAWAFTGEPLETLLAPGVTPPATPLPTPLPTPPATPLPTPLFDAPSNEMKVKHLIGMGYSKIEIMGEVWGLTKADKNGRPGSKYQECSKLFDQWRDEYEQVLKNAARNQLEGIFPGATTNGH